MINLLPEQEKRDVYAARTNVILLRYNLVTVAAIFVIAAFCLAFYVTLYNNQQEAVAEIHDNNQHSASLSSVKTAANDYRSNLTLAKTILNNSLSYTDVIIAITKLLPDGVVLDSLSLSSISFTQQTTFSAHTTSYATAEQLKQSFQSSKIFSNVYFQTLGTSSGSGGISGKYPVSVSLTATLNNNAGTFNGN
jgi:hypothetical protein